MEHLAHSALAPFQMSQEELNQSFAPEVAQAFASLTRLDGREFSSRVFDAILAGLERMNSLVRTDPFWTNTNRRPTIYKLAEFCHIELIRSPNDPNILFAEAVLAVWFGRNDFGQEAWYALSRLPGFDLRWPIYAAVTTHLSANSTEDQLAEFLSEPNVKLAAIPVLRRFECEAGGLVVLWARTVLRLLDELR
jgi:hypothetical protein